MLTADQLIVHVIGDFMLQSDWMARSKTRDSFAAAVHAIIYAIPFLVFRPSPLAWFTIAGSHFLIDRWRLARYVCWASGLLAPPPYRSWTDCKQTGYAPEKEPWMSAWLLIIADNTLHVLINALSLRRL
ncbi:MAG TPA: DUF3307 domain-containing protein [Chloroflexota bacterium]|jgi:hypothetical protein